MPIPMEYNVDDVIAMIINDKDLSGAKHLHVHRLIHHATMHSVDEELGTIDKLCRNQLETEGESTVFRGPNNRERIGGYEQPAVADADVTSSAASLAVMPPAGSSRRSKVGLYLTTN